MQHSNIVINLIGTEYNTRNFTMQEVNVNTAAKIAEIAKEAGVSRLIHLSALNASEKPPSVLKNPQGNEFLRTKFEGEKLVKEIFPEVTIFRPADIFGHGDKFL